MAMNKTSIPHSLLIGLVALIGAPLLCAAPSGGPAAEVHPEVLNLQASFAKVSGLVKPPVVNIATVQIEQVVESPMFYYGDPLEQFYDPYGGSVRPRTRQFKSEGVGSGVIIDAEGLVLTNEHLVRRADQINV